MTTVFNYRVQFFKYKEECALYRKGENVEVYKQLARYPVFTIKEVERLTGNIKTAYSQLGRLMKKDLVRKVRVNIYSPVNPMTRQIAATRYQIACAITDTAYISHHSAFEYYGLANQVFNEVYVSSDTRFNNFVYENISYSYVASRICGGINLAKNTTGVKITDMERTVVDSIHDFNKIGGFEELTDCLDGIHFLDEVKLLKYLEAYNNKSLYQRTGFILQQYERGMQISAAFFKKCKERIGSSRRYLVKELTDNNIYNSEWQLMVPEDLFEITGQGGDVLA